MPSSLAAPSGPFSVLSLGSPRANQGRCPVSSKSSPGRSKVHPGLRTKGGRNSVPCGFKWPLPFLETNSWPFQNHSSWHLLGLAYFGLFLFLFFLFKFCTWSPEGWVHAISQFLVCSYLEERKLSLGSSPFPFFTQRAPFLFYFIYGLFCFLLKKNFVCVLRPPF